MDTQDASEDVGWYDMSRERKRIALIINNQEFPQRAPSVQERASSKKDARRLQNVLETLHFDTVVKSNLTRQELLEALENVAYRDHADTACVVVAILSHGSNKLKCTKCNGGKCEEEHEVLEQIIATDEQRVSIAEITAPFKDFGINKCRNLVHKPKLFFIQACRGDEVDHGIKRNKKRRMDVVSDGDSNDEEDRWPLEADFLLAFSSPPGQKAWRCPSEGSWFIMNLCEVLRTRGEHEEVSKLLKLVKRKMCCEVSYSIGTYGWIKQIPSIQDQLTKELYFSYSGPSADETTKPQIDENPSDYEMKPVNPMPEPIDDFKPDPSEHITPSTRVRCYKVDHARRGMALIINNRDFKASTGMGSRKSSDLDAARLRHLFDLLGFTTKIATNLDSKEMMRGIQEVAWQDHSDADCVVVVILSHGDEGGVYSTDGIVPLDAVYSLFKSDDCIGLAGKPKLFFIQACRGDNFDKGVIVADADADDEATSSKRQVLIPLAADFLVASSTAPGYYSWRSSEIGGWFINDLCDVFDEYGEHEDIIGILTEVNYRMSERSSNTANRSMSNMKQVASFRSELRKKLYLRKK